KLDRAKFTATNLRSAVSTLTARAVGAKDFLTGSTMTNELARQAVMNWLDGSSNTYIALLNKEIKERRKKGNASSLILSGVSVEKSEQVFIYLGLVFAREWLVRLALAVIRKQGFTLEIALTWEMVTNEGISAFGAALETVIYDVSILDKTEARQLAQTIV